MGRLIPHCSRCDAAVPNGLVAGLCVRCHSLDRSAPVLPEVSDAVAVSPRPVVRADGGVACESVWGAFGPIVVMDMGEAS